jgi:hypothetical protein
MNGIIIINGLEWVGNGAKIQVQTVIIFFIMAGTDLKNSTRSK